MSKEKEVIQEQEEVSKKDAEVKIEKLDEIKSADLVGSEEKKQTVVVKGKKKKKVLPFLRGGCGQVYIKSTYNNTIVSVVDLNGAVLVWSSAGKCGFSGPKKSTPYAAGVVVKSIIEKAKEFGIKEVKVIVKGIGMGREAAIRALDTNGLKIVSIKDVNPIPHGGCRPRKKRRV